MNSNMDALAKDAKRESLALVLVFCVLAAGIVTAGSLYYRNYARHYRDGAERQISSIAVLKVAELVQYRKERLWDANTLFKNLAFSGLVRRFFDHPEDADAQQQLQVWADKYLATEQYDHIRLFDAQGVPRLSIPAGRPPISSAVSQRIPEVLRSGQVTWHDLHRNEHDQQIYLTLLVPILDGPDHSQALGVLALRINPQTYLYPFINRWPVPSRTGETLLVRRDGNDVLFLNELKFATNTALNLRIPLANTNVAAVKAVLGRTGIVEGRVYRGEPVIADVRAVPGSPWFLEARENVAEVFAPLRERFWMTILLMGGLLLGTGAGMSAISRHQRIQFYKERYQTAEALRESENRYRAIMEQAADAVIMHDQTGRILDVNQKACQCLGYSREELLAKSIGDLDPEAIQAGKHELWGKILAGEQFTFESRHLCKDGSFIPVEVSLGSVRLPPGPVVLGIVRDITERKRAEEALRESERRFQTLAISSPVGIFQTDAQGQTTYVNPQWCEIARLSATEALGVGWLRAVHPDDREKIAQGWQAATHEQGTSKTDYRFVRPDGTIVWVMGQAVPEKDDAGRIVGYVGTITDITERKRAEAELGRRAKELAALNSLTRGVSSSLSLEAVVASALREMLNAIQTDLAFLFLREGERLVLGGIAPESGRERLGQIPEHRVGECMCGLAVRLGQSLYSRDIFNDQRCTWEECKKAGFRSFAALPLRIGDEIIGVVGLASATERDFEQQATFLETLANAISVSLQNARLFANTKQAAEALRESQALYHSLVEQMPAGVFRKDRAGRYVFVNAWLCQFHSLEADKFIGRTPDELVPAEATRGPKHPEVLQLFRDGSKHHEEILRTGKPIHVEEVYFTTEGGKQYLHVVKSAIFGSDGQIVGTQGVQFDITERKRAEEALRRSETQLRVILESTGDGILAVDSQGKAVIKANRRFAELWGIPQSTVDAGDNRALRNFALKQLADPDAFLKKLQSLDGTDDVARDTLVFKDGRIFERHGFPMMMDGTVIGRVWSFRDVTERKRQEEELKQKNTELERFTYTVSHDLKSPLVTVKTFLGYLEQDLLTPDPERVKQDMVYMRTATDKMGQLLDELLNLARVGRKVNPTVRVAFRELAQEAVRLVAGRISTSGVEVQVAEAAVVLEGDRPRLREIWQNLVENACKFMGNQPKPRVEIGVEQRGPETVFFVRDNGMGIEPHYQTKVFGLFEQLNPKGEGTGMGLALVKRIVELYGGRIWIESPEPGQGANFLFTLPGAVVTEMEQMS